MDVARVREAFRQRLDDLQRDDPDLRVQDIASRMGMSIKTVDNLRYERPKGSFSAATLRKASRALEWPDEALELIADGLAGEDDFPHVPWDEGHSDDDRMARIESEQSRLADELADIGSAVADLRKLVAEVLDHEERG